MHADAFHIVGYPFVSPVETVEHFRSLLPTTAAISKLNDPGTETKEKSDDVLDITHCEVDRGDNLKIIEQGGFTGLDRLLGAILISESERFTVTCVEVYSHDNLVYPHAEPFDASP
ncbi:hypothetical protein BGZ76_004823 [Entomortierella beljakovae]|nr:hypothetical protein BGZ76_004823 [Entomortierella beljakovae]